MVDGAVQTRDLSDAGRGDACGDAWLGRAAPLIVAVHIGAGKCAASLVDGAGALSGDPASADESSLFSLVEDVLKDARGRGLDVRGLAFALPTRERWLEIASSAARKFGLAIATSSVADAALEGEMIARSAAANRGAALLLDGDQIQAAMQLHGKPYTGLRGRAGAIAHLGLDRTGAVACACGRTGCLSALVRAGAAASETPLPPALLPAPSRPLGWLATAAIALVNVLNPALVFVQGAAFETPSALSWFERAVRAGCLAETGVGLRDVARVGPCSVLVGAASLAATRFS